ncbi:DUF3168 domain-containing protein [Mesorhizobium sp.]|uniref:DUF3168 domain-containing protein n=1 Tax=Mesorhizobium sp. TaxID=1871066 RepID=UPI00121F0864|nr:DUF3168 domain-containing protein [Mesorhizobium sp.]TIN83101.1 MAG: DUF3168 domain-containing protein [Mesorhizobium sp.]
MSSSSLDLQDLILQTLKGTPAIMDLVNGVWDKPPATYLNEPKEAAITFAGFDTAEDGADCVSGVETTAQLDVWSRKVGFPNCQQITDLVRKALHNQELILPGSGNALVQMWVTLTKVERDPDGITSHGVIFVTASIEEDVD